MNRIAAIYFPSLSLRARISIAIAFMLLLLPIHTFVSAQTTGTISGTLYDSTTGQPIRYNGTPEHNAWASLFEYPSYNHIQGAGNDDNGDYQLSVAPGTYYLNGGGEYYLETPYGGNENPTPITLGDGETMTIDFYLDPAGRIEGVVKNDGGDPLENMGIGVANMPIGGCTEPDGSYDLRVPLNTSIKFVVWGDDCSGQPTQYAQEWWNDKNSEESADAVTFTMTNRDLLNADFTLELKGQVEGMVYEADGVTPLSEEAYIAAFDVATYDYVDGVPSQLDGSYTLSISPGTYRIATYAPGYVYEYYDNVGTDMDAATPITVTSGGIISDIDFSLEVGGTVEGRVTDARGNPLSDVMVGVMDMYMMSCTDSGGYYSLSSFDSVPLNTPLTVWAGGDFNVCENGRTDYAQEFWQEAETPDSATTVTVTDAGTPVMGVNFTLHYWLDMDGNNAITPSDAVYVHNRMDQSPVDVRADVNNDGLVTVDDFNAIMGGVGQKITP